MAWAVGVITLIAVSQTWSLHPVYKNQTVKLGHNVTLQCTNKTWSEILYIIWKISLKSKECELGFSDEGRSHNYCDNSKSLQNTSSGMSYLLITNFSKSDEGIYNCDSAYKGGSVYVKFNVSVTVPPKMSAWVEWKDSRWVAVCSATDGKPAASIIWRNMENSSVPEVTTLSQPDGFYTVTSELDLPQDVATATGNLTCAVSHFSWAGEKTVILERASPVAWKRLLLYLLSVGLIAAFLGLSYFASRKQIASRYCCRSSTTPLQQSKPAAIEVEEVEPYASYVQRVNCIYNSSSDLLR